MKYFTKRLLAFVWVLFLAACGGGEGSPGFNLSAVSGSTASNSSATTTTSSTTPTLKLALTNSAGTVLTENAITSGNAFFAKATLLDAKGAAIPNALVSFSTDATIGTLASTTVLTNLSGVGTVQISPTSLTVTNAAELKAQASVNSQALSDTLNYQTSAAKVVIGTVTPSAISITALQSSAVTASVTVNGVAATAGQVSVTFTAPSACGSFSPATVTTSSSGIAASTYQPTSTCSGLVQLAAAAAGTNPVTGSITVVAAEPSNILYDSASATSLVVSSATSGTKQSTVKFKVVAGNGNGLASKNVTFSLDQQSIGAGVTFSTGAGLTNLNQSVFTDGTGVASIIVQSGTLPTPVVVTASVTSLMFASSSGLVVTSGKASQNKSNLSAVALSLEEGFTKDGITTQVIVRVSDRQSNPIPVGTAVTFVASHGLVTGFCLTNERSECSVTYSTILGTRPENGRVTILAYMDGEESFVDQNGNNVWDPTEPFDDTGTVYRDDNGNSSWDSNEQIYPGGTVGSVACPSNAYLSKTNTCDGKWSSSIRVRQAITLTLASPPSLESITLSSSATTDGFSVIISDSRFPALGMPTGTTVSAAVGSTAAGCSVVTVSPAKVADSAFASTHQIQLNANAACAKAQIDVTVTTPGGAKITKPIFIP